MTERDVSPVALIVLDGWGYREERVANAILLANTPNWDRVWSHPSRTLLQASGNAVGLPKGQMGNSEVGHMNLGAGRVVMQDLVRISTAIADGSFFANPTLVNVCRAVRERGGTVHVVGLLGNGGVHALDEHLLAVVELAHREGVPRVAVHGMLDGRDTPPKSGLGFLNEMFAGIAGKATLASLSGRYYGMDRDNRWERTGAWYRAAVNGDGPHVLHTPAAVQAAVQAAYDAGTTDEFVPPMVMVNDDGTAVAPMHDGDVVICFNFRSDRMRQALRALTVKDFDGFDTGDRPDVDIVTMTRYDDAFPFPVAFQPQSMANLVGEVISDGGMTQLRTAETEKYPHVTFFFNGGHDKPFPGEDRQMVPSPKVATYDLQPEMSADGVCDILCHALEHRTHDFILCNFANADMVGHTGSLPAAITAVETVDACLGRILAAATIGGARLLITADHGNADMMADAVTGEPYTAHTTNPVPFVLIEDATRVGVAEGAAPLRSGGALCDVGPTVLGLLDRGVPSEITGRDLRDLTSSVTR